MAIRVGTSGFAYDDWVGPVYPDGTPRRRFFDLYCRRFDLLELNYTYYTLPAARTLAGLVRRAPPGFAFTVKLHRSMTHEALAPSDASLGAFRAALEPLSDPPGRMPALLAQFPPSLRPGIEARRRLEALRRAFDGLPLVFEFRSRAWLTAPVRRWMRWLGVAWCGVDQPPLPDLLPPEVWFTAPPAYVRFHGRNAASWYRHAHPAERYHYRYAREELVPWAARLRRLEAAAGTVLALFDNHFRGNAVDDASTLRALLEEPES